MSVMKDPEQHESSLAAAPAQEAAAVTSSPAETNNNIDDEPYSIFDNRQRALIVFLVSVAATCE